MNRVGLVFGSALVGISCAFGIRFQINSHFAVGYHRARFWIVLEITSRYLIKTVGVAPVHGDLDVMQLGVPALLELHSLACIETKQRAPLLGFRNAKPI